MISISCLESKLLNNNNWYGRFQLAPFRKGEGLTVANALRRTLLADKSNFYITWVDFYNAEIPYSVLTGMRESIFDILLNLKQVIFTSDIIIPNSGFFLETSAESMLSRSCTAIPKNLLLGETSSLKFSSGRGYYSYLQACKQTIQRFNRNNGLDQAYSKRIPTQNIRNWEDKTSITLNSSLKVKRQTKPPTESRFQNSVIMPSIGKKIILPQAKYEPLSGISDSLDNSDSNQISDSNYTAYICAKGPAVIYAKNIKLPKGLKCVDPDKYIVTLADDGLFYLRFALTGEIESYTATPSLKENRGTRFDSINKIKPHVPSRSSADKKKINMTYPISTDVNKGFDFLTVWKINKALNEMNNVLFLSKKDKSSPKISTSFNNVYEKSKSSKKEAASHAKSIPEFDQKRHRRSYLANKKNYDNLLVGHSLDKADQNSYNLTKQKIEKNVEQVNKFSTLNNVIDSVNYSSNNYPNSYTKDLIKTQHLLYTNDTIKQRNFQIPSIIAQIQKTCLLNIQIKHYYYKCGRFDRFLFDLIKPFKPYIKSSSDKERYLNRCYFLPALTRWEKKKSFAYHTSYCLKSIMLPKKEIFSDSFFSSRACRLTTGKAEFLNSLLNYTSLSLPLMDRQKSKCYQRLCFEKQRTRTCFSKKKHLRECDFSFLMKKTILEGYLRVGILGWEKKRKDHSFATNRLVFPQFCNSSLYSSVFFHSKSYLFSLSGKLKQFNLLNYELPLIALQNQNFLNDRLDSTWSFPVVFSPVFLQTDRLLKSRDKMGKAKWFIQKKFSSSNSFAQQWLTKFFSNSFCYCLSNNSQQTFAINYMLRDTRLELQLGTSTRLIKKQPIINTYQTMSGKPPRCILLQAMRWGNKQPHCFILNIYFKLEFWIKQGSKDSKENERLEQRNDNDIRSFYRLKTRMNKFYRENFRDGRLYSEVVKHPLLDTFLLLSNRIPNHQKTLKWIPDSFSLRFLSKFYFLKEWRPINLGIMSKSPTKVKPIPNNSIVLKPIYLNIEQIFYILKQSATFRKNQRINPSFFDLRYRFFSFLTQTGILADNSCFLRPYQNKLSMLKIKAWSDLAWRVSVVPRWSLFHLLGGNKIYHPPGGKMNFTPGFLVSRKDKIDKTMGYNPKSKSLKRNSVIIAKKNSLSPKGFLIFQKNHYASKSFLDLKVTKLYFDKKNISPGGFFLSRQQNRKFLCAADGKNNQTKSLSMLKFSLNSDILHHFLLLGQSEINQYKLVPNPNLQFRFLRNTDSSAEGAETRSISNKSLSSWRSFISPFLYVHRLFFLSGIGLTLCRFIFNSSRIKNSERIKITNNYKRTTHKLTTQYLDKISNLSLNFKINHNSLQIEPFNINIYHSKIAYTLRYMYPFKYTIFETFLQFLFKGGSVPNSTLYKSRPSLLSGRRDLIGGAVLESLPTNLKFEKQKFKFDLIQYNESFKIYTNLASPRIYPEKSSNSSKRGLKGEEISKPWTTPTEKKLNLKNPSQEQPEDKVFPLLGNTWESGTDEKQPTRSMTLSNFNPELNLLSKGGYPAFITPSRFAFPKSSTGYDSWFEYFSERFQVLQKNRKAGESIEDFDAFHAKSLFISRNKQRTSAGESIFDAFHAKSLFISRNKQRTSAGESIFDAFHAKSLFISRNKQRVSAGGRDSSLFDAFHAKPNLQKRFLASYFYSKGYPIYIQSIIPSTFTLERRDYFYSQKFYFQHGNLHNELSFRPVKEKAYTTVPSGCSAGIGNNLTWSAWNIVYMGHSINPSGLELFLLDNKKKTRSNPAYQGFFGKVNGISTYFNSAQDTLPKHTRDEFFDTINSPQESSRGAGHSIIERKKQASQQRLLNRPNNVREHSIKKDRSFWNSFDQENIHDIPEYFFHLKKGGQEKYDSTLGFLMSCPIISLLLSDPKSKGKQSFLTEGFFSTKKNDSFWNETNFTALHLGSNKLCQTDFTLSSRERPLSISSKIKPTKPTNTEYLHHVNKISSEISKNYDSLFASKWPIMNIFRVNDAFITIPYTETFSLYSNVGIQGKKKTVNSGNDILRTNRIMKKNSLNLLHTVNYSTIKAKKSQMVGFWQEKFITSSMPNVYTSNVSRSKNFPINNIWLHSYFSKRGLKGKKKEASLKDKLMNSQETFDASLTGHDQLNWHQKFQGQIAENLLYNRGFRLAERIPLQSEIGGDSLPRNPDSGTTQISANPIQKLPFSKNLAISFENIYYKNVLWNSKKITFRLLTNSIFPLVANRKFSLITSMPSKPSFSNKTNHIVNSKNSNRRYSSKKKLTPKTKPARNQIVTKPFAYFGDSKIYYNEIQTIREKCLNLFGYHPLALPQIESQAEPEIVNSPRGSVLFPGSPKEEVEYKTNNFNSRAIPMEDSLSIIDLWFSSFFCMYSLYGISTKSDVFLQNLISNEEWTLSKENSENNKMNLTPLLYPSSSSFLKKRENSQRFVSLQRETKHQPRIPTHLKSLTFQESLKRVRTPFSSVYGLLGFTPNLKHCSRAKGTLLGLNWNIYINKQRVTRNPNKSKNRLTHSSNYNWRKTAHFEFLRNYKKNYTPRRMSTNEKIKPSWSAGYTWSKINFFFYFIPSKARKFLIKNLGLAFLSTSEGYKKTYIRPLLKQWTNSANQNKLVLFYKKPFSYQGPFVFKGIEKKLSQETLSFPTITCTLLLSSNFFETDTNKNSNLQIVGKDFFQNNSRDWFKGLFLDLKTEQEIGTYPVLVQKKNSLAEKSRISRINNLAPDIDKNRKKTKPLTEVQPWNKIKKKLHLGKNMTSSVPMDHQGYYGMVSYFTIKESLNSIHKVNYIVESHSVGFQPIPMFERKQQETFDRKLTHFQTSRFEREEEKEYIQIDIWTNGSLSPRQALLNAFKKLFELFYNLSKYNCLKPIEI